MKGTLLPSNTPSYKTTKRNETFIKKGEMLSEEILRKTISDIEKEASLEIFQIDQLLSLIENQIAPIVLMAGSFKIMLAYKAMKKILEKMRNQKQQSQESANETDDRWGYSTMEY